MNVRAETEQVKSLANARAGEVLHSLGIKERPNQAGLILMSSPRRKDVKASFAIWHKRGFIAWKDFGSGERGDIIGLVAHLRGWDHLPHKGFPEAMRWLEDRLGIKHRSPAELAADAARARSVQQRAAINADAARERNQRRAFGLWLAANPIVGSRADTYLREARGIDLGAFPPGPRGGARAPSILRSLESHPHRDDAGKETEWPCMIAGCVDAQGKIRAVHRTWLDRNGVGKAPVSPARKCWPSVAGLFIPLWRGETGMSVKEAAAAGLRETLVLTEGIEDGLTAALSAPQFRVWAAISLSNLANMPIPECVDSIIVHRQNDWLKLQAVQQFESAKAALEASGRPVVEVAAMGGKDLNDTLRGAA